MLSDVTRDEGDGGTRMIRGTLQSMSLDTGSGMIEGSMLEPE